jgi:hypothetical protein
MAFCASMRIRLMQHLVYANEWHHRSAEQISREETHHQQARGLMSAATAYDSHSVANVPEAICTWS